MDNMLEVTTPGLRVATANMSENQASIMADVMAFLEQEIRPYVSDADDSPAEIIRYYRAFVAACSSDPLLTEIALQPPMGYWMNAAFPQALLNVIWTELNSTLGPETADSDWYAGFERYFNTMSQQGAISSGVNLRMGFANVRSVRHLIFGHQPQICFTVLIFRWLEQAISNDEREAMHAAYAAQMGFMRFEGQMNPDLAQFLASAQRNWVLFSGATFGFTMSEWHNEQQRIQGNLDASSKAAIKVAPLGA